MNAFLQQARTGSNAFWLYLLTLVAVVFGTFVGQVPLTYLVWKRAEEAGMDVLEMQAALKSMDLEALGIGQTLFLVLAVLSFAGGLAMLWLMVTRAHDKPFRSILTGRPNLDWGRIRFAFVFWLGVSALADLAFFLLEPANYSFAWSGGRWVLLLVVAVLFLPIQTSFEEILFRGYLLQGLSLLARHPVIPLVLTSVGFGSLHFMNPEVEQFGLGIMMTYYIGVGLFLGLITLLDEGLELALGIHAATNIYGAVFVTFDSSALPTPALFHLQEVNVQAMLLAFVLGGVLFAWVAWKKYGWSWKRLGKTRLQPAPEPLESHPD